MKKILPIILLTLFIPQFAFASWWNPFTWFKKKPVSPTVEQVSIQKPLEIPVIKSKEKKEVAEDNKSISKKTEKAPVTSQKKEPQKENKVVAPPPVVPFVFSEPKTNPVILAISNIHIEPKITSVYISWQTNMSTESKILLNGTAYQSKNGVDAVHYVEIKDLVGGKSYAGTITALANNAWTSQEVTFNTKEVPPKPVEIPVILPTLSFGYTFPPQGYILVESNGRERPATEVATPKTDVVMWQNTATVGVKNVKLQNIKFRNIGSASHSAFANLRLYVNDVPVGTSGAIDGNGYVTFDFIPITLNVGDHTIKMVADVVSGFSRTVTWSLRNTQDINVVDSETGQRISVSGFEPFNIPFTAGTQTIGSN